MGPFLTKAWLRNARPIRIDITLDIKTENVVDNTLYACRIVYPQKHTYIHYIEKTYRSILYIAGT